MQTFLTAGSWFMFVIAGLCLSYIVHCANSHDPRRLPGLMQLGIFGERLTALIYGAHLQQVDVCTPEQFTMRVVLFGVSTAVILLSLLLQELRYGQRYSRIT